MRCGSGGGDEIRRIVWVLCNSENTRVLNYDLIYPCCSTLDYLVLT